MLRLLSPLQLDGFSWKSEDVCGIMVFATWLFGGVFEGLGFEPWGIGTPKIGECHGVAMLPGVDVLWFVFAFLFR